MRTDPVAGHRALRWPEIDITPCYSKTQRDFATATRLDAARLLDLSPFSIVEHPLDSFVDAVAAASDPAPGEIHVIDFEL